MRLQITSWLPFPQLNTFGISVYKGFKVVYMIITLKPLIIHRREAFGMCNSPQTCIKTKTKTKKKKNITTKHSISTNAFRILCMGYKKYIKAVFPLNYHQTFLIHTYRLSSIVRACSQ